MDDGEFEDDTPGPMGMPFTFITEIPEELKQKMQEQRDRHEMAAEVWRHEVNDLLHALNPEQLATFRRLLMAMDANTVNYYNGVVTTLLEIKHGVCPGCGKNHDEDLMAVGQEVHDPDGDQHE